MIRVPFAKSSLVAMTLLVATPAAAGGAGIACPSADAAGRPLRAGATGTLYLGDPAERRSQAPDGMEAQADVFRLPHGGSEYVLVCAYRGGVAGAPIEVPASARECRQDASSFACR